MEREWTDDLDRRWTVSVEAPEDPHGERGDVALVFDGGGAEVYRMDILGPMEEVFHELDDDDLQLALDAATSGLGRILVDREGKPWWVREPEDDPLEEGAWAVKFTRGGEDLVHDGPLVGDVHEMSEDQLLELLDELRGNIMDPMDVRRE